MSNTTPDLPRTPSAGQPATELAAENQPLATCRMCGGTVVGWPEACPHCGEEQRHVEDPQSYRLFALSSIVIASFFGSLAAGGLLMAINYRRMGHAAAAWVVGLGSAFFAATIFAVLSSSLGAGSSVPHVLVAWIVGKTLQGAAINRHERAGGKSASLLVAIGIGLIGFVFLFLLPELVAYLRFASQRDRF